MLCSQMAVIATAKLADRPNLWDNMIIILSLSILDSYDNNDDIIFLHVCLDLSLRPSEEV